MALRPTQYLTSERCGLRDCGSHGYQHPTIILEDVQKGRNVNPHVGDGVHQRLLGGRDLVEECQVIDDIHAE